MSTYDYSSDIAFALDMITQFGRLVDFHRVSETPANPSKPLEGGGADEDVLGVNAVFVEPTSLRSLGISQKREGVWQNSTMIALVAADGVNNFLDFTTITDSDGSTWAIDNTDEFRPGDVPVLYYIGVKR